MRMLLSVVLLVCVVVVLGLPSPMTPPSAIMNEVKQDPKAVMQIPAADPAKVVLPPLEHHMTIPPPPMPVGLAPPASENKGLMLEDGGLHTSEMMEGNQPIPDVNAPQQKSDAPQPATNNPPIDEATGVQAKNPEEPEALDLVITIPTMRRWTRDRQLAPEKYLTTLVDDLAYGLTEKQKQHTKFMLYNVDKEPEKHVEVEELKKRHGNLIEVLVKPQKANAPEHNPNESVTMEKQSGEIVTISHGTMEWVAGETNDATSLLFDARKRAPYVMFLEDDVKPTSHAVTKLTEFVNEMKHRQIDNWFMIDLYTPKINWGRNPLYVQNFERYDYECCTQSMLFRSDRLLDLLLYETLHPNLPIDDNIRDFAREDDSRGIYAITPNLFQHVGRYSSNPEKSSETVEHQSLNFVP